MKEIMKFLGDVNTPIAVATVYGDEPRVRFFSFKMEVDGKLYLLTSEKKHVYMQLKKNNHIEISSLPNDKFEWVRVNATVSFVKDVELNKHAFSLLPLLEKAYKTPENREIVLLRLDNIDARKYTLGGGSVKL